MRIIIMNEPEPKHLAEVKEQMKIMGTPKIRAFYDKAEGLYWALEGSHRIIAAKELGLEPEIEEVEYNDELITVQWDGYDEEFKASEFIDELLKNCHKVTLSRIISFKGDEE